MPRLYLPLAAFLLLILMLSPGPAAAAQPPTSAAPLSAAWATPGVILVTGVPVPMRDGVVLRADIRRPVGPGPFPALICRTPYGKSSDRDELRFARRAVARGYAVVLMDVRGRYASGGEFEPHVNEGRDGYDAIEWVAARKWCDGRVGTFGLSYPGSAQWFAALEQPPHLLAMAPAMSFASLRAGIRYQGVLDMDWLRWALVNIAPDYRARKNLPGPRTADEAWTDWERRITAALLGKQPLLDLPEVAKAPPFFAEWLRHPSNDPWWDFGDLAGKYSRVTAAVLNLTGWHDDAFSVAGAIENHLGLTAARQGQASGADARSLLVIGPWSHGINSVTGDAQYGTRDFGPLSHLDYDALVLDFMDLYVRGIKNRLAGAKPVRYFVMGENQWREADAWPPAGMQERELFLGPERRSRVYNRLSHAAPTNAPGAAPGAGPGAGPGSGLEETSFTADPANPVREIPGTSFGPTDQRSLAGHRDLLQFQTRPLTADLTIAGRVRAEIYLSTDVPDLDLYVMLLDVAPDGTAYNLMSTGAEVLRASQRRGPGRHAPLTPGKVHRLVFDTLLTANTFHKGDRVRVVLCASWFPAMSRNLQTGESELVSAVTRPATIAIHHSKEYPSRLILPAEPFEHPRLTHSR